MNTLKNLFDHMTAAQALENGFTHHGSYYGIPVWIKPFSGFQLATKWAALEPLVRFLHNKKIPGLKLCQLQINREIA